MSEEQQEIVAKQGTGIIAGVIACVLAVLGILFLGVVFVPIAAIVAFIGTIIAIKNSNLAGIGVNILAWVLRLWGYSRPQCFLESLVCHYSVKIKI